MGKAPAAGEGKAPSTGAPAEKKDSAHGGGGGSHGAPNASGKGHNPGPDGCHSWGCKGKATRFNFCNEHYDHFKFGLIKKTGEPVPDYEKKFEHYRAHVARRGSQKVA